MHECRVYYPIQQLLISSLVHGGEDPDSLIKRSNLFCFENAKHFKNQHIQTALTSDTEHHEQQRIHKRKETTNIKQQPNGTEGSAYANMIRVSVWF